MNGSSPQTFSKSLQRPANLAMMASMVAHGFLFAGLALVPATGQQNPKKSLRVVSLLQPSPEQPGQPKQQPLDPNAPPPAPGVAGLPFNITTPGNLPELSTTTAPNAAFDTFSSSVVDLPSNPQPNVVPNPSINPGPSSLAQQVPPASNPAKPSNPNAPTLSDKDFQDWLNGTDKLPIVFDDSGSSVPLNQPQTPPDLEAQLNLPPNPANQGGNDTVPETNPALKPEKAPFKKELAPPDQMIERRVAYNYPKAACKDRLEGQAEYRIWVSAQAKPVVSGIVVSSNSDILDRAVKTEARKYKITAGDANKLVKLPFDFQYSEKVCATQNKPSTQPNLDPAVPQSPAPAPETDEPKLEDKTDEPKLEDKNGQNLPTPQPAEPSPVPTQQPQPDLPVSQPTEPIPPAITPAQPPSTSPPAPQPIEPFAPAPPVAPPIAPPTVPPSKSLSAPSVPPAAAPSPTEDASQTPPDPASPTSPQTAPSPVDEPPAN